MAPVKKARLKKGITQQELAEKVGCSQSRIARLESRLDNASPALAAKLAQVLGISEMEILYPDRTNSVKHGKTE